MERDDPKFTSTWGHTEASTTCVTAHSENNLKPGQTDLPELKTSREGHIEKCTKVRDKVRNQTPGVAIHNQEGHHRYGGVKRISPTSGIPGPEDLHREDEPP